MSRCCHIKQSILKLDFSNSGENTMAFDFKKEYKEFYLPKDVPAIVTVPEANYIAIRGKGNPNETGGEYQKAVGVLYSVAYTLKMSYKTDYKIERLNQMAIIAPFDLT